MLKVGEQYQNSKFKKKAFARRQTTDGRRYIALPASEQRGHSPEEAMCVVVLASL